MTPDEVDKLIDDEIADEYVKEAFPDRIAALKEHIRALEWIIFWNICRVDVMGMGDTCEAAYKGIVDKYPVASPSLPPIDYQGDNHYED